MHLDEIDKKSMSYMVFKNNYSQPNTNTLLSQHYQTHVQRLNNKFACQPNFAVNVNL